jgi:hypothetical protein
MAYAASISNNLDSIMLKFSLTVSQALLMTTPPPNYPKPQTCLKF